MAKKSENTLVDKMFGGIPQLRSYFKAKECEIKRLEQEEAFLAAETRRKKMDKLLKAAKEMNIRDLETVYCIHNIIEFRPFRIYQIFSKINEDIECLFEMKKQAKKS